ncbi:inner centromere protein isoform X2 [Anolis carolinensis]|uniref:inner centromere protein-like isoform X2 n=1 Tax=Anolis carolinensis TaxID=28377 RepID=UPI000462D381|nr:PREDICTED: inner centromere protein-like [Anolis carolinensis]|eukprot:XP_008103548.1 PREDICTED: inner centromere protein-like [Anolis carolinensis]
MAVPKFKSERDMRDSRAQSRRPSHAEDINLRDILQEIQKLAERQEEHQREAQLKLDKQAYQQKELHQEMLEMKKEIKEDIGFLKREMEKSHRDINELKVENIKIIKSQGKLQKKLDGLEFKNEKLEKMQEKMELNEKEFQLRFRNIQEEANENLRKIIVKLVSDLLKQDPELIDNGIDQVYRIQTNFSRRNRAHRDVIIHFVKKRTRDEILMSNNRNPMYFKEKKIIVLKEFPQAILNRRRKYFFLTDELKRQKIRFRWERSEGIMVTWKGEKHWLTSEEKAKDFFQKLKQDKKENVPIPPSPPSVKRKKPKRARHISPKDSDLKVKLNPTASGTSDVGDDNEEESEEREDEDIESEEEDKMEEENVPRAPSGAEGTDYGVE